MIAGLPGTGIGGIYYVFAALWMPFRELLARARGKQGPSRWGLIFGQVALAITVTAIMWISGDLIGRLMMLCTAWNHPAATAVQITTEVAKVDPGSVITGKYNFIRATFIYWTTGAVVLLHLIIHGTRLGVRLAQRRQLRESA